MLDNKELVTNFKDKANIFNAFFSKQCQPITQNSTFPSIQTFETSNRLKTIDVASKKILKLIQGLNSNKGHGRDGISTRMLKLCEPSITKPLSLFLSNCLRDGKKQMLFQCIKKEINRYRSLPFFITFDDLL